MQKTFCLFFIFAKIGLFTLGGGYAMLSLMERELVDKRHWLERAEFLDLVAVAQAAPGILAVNMAIFVGYKLSRVRGAMAAALGAVLPSFVVILLLALFFKNYQDNQWVQRAFSGVRPAVAALIAVPVFRLGHAAKINYKNCWIPVLVALLVWRWHVSPVYMIVAAGVGGWCYARLHKAGVK